MAKPHGDTGKGKWPTVDGTKVNADEVAYAGHETGLTAPPIYHPLVPKDMMESVWVSGIDPSQITWNDAKVSQAVRDAVAGYKKARPHG